jgi:hypothetical protein
MKNPMQYLALMLTVCFLLANNATFAQEEEEGHIYVVTTSRAVMPDDGTEAERDSLIMELRDAQKSNEKVLSQINLRHTYGNDSHDWVVITEYKSWADIPEAGKINQELNKKKWPDEKERQDFFRKLGKYFDGHSDEIYTELPKFGK